MLSGLNTICVLRQSPIKRLKAVHDEDKLTLPKNCQKKKNKSIFCENVFTDTFLQFKWHVSTEPNVLFKHSHFVVMDL